MTSKSSTASLAATLVAAAALAVTGCSSTPTGNASPSTTSASASTASTASANPFGALNACQVIDQLLAGQGFNPGDKQTVRNECHSSKLDFGTYSIALDPVQGLGEYSADNPGATATTVNGRMALEAEPDRGMCEFALEVGQHARALATATMDPDLRAQACPNALQFAEKLEPLLPKDQ